MAYAEYATRINAPIEGVWKALIDLKNPKRIEGVAANARKMLSC